MSTIAEKLRNNDALVVVKTGGEAREIADAELSGVLRRAFTLWRTLKSLEEEFLRAKDTIARRAGERAGERSQFKFSRTPLEELSNDLAARLKRNYSRLMHDSAWDATASASDPASQSKYGVYPKEVDFELIRDSAMASHVLAHMLLERKEPRLAVEFPVFWEHFDLEPGDTIEVENPLYGGRKFLIESIRRTDKFRAEVRAEEWW